MADSQIASGPGSTDAPQPLVARTRDTPELRSRIQDWLRAKMPRRSVELVQLAMPSSNGMSAETFLIDLKIDGKIEKFVMRREPEVHTIFVGLDNAHQHRVMRALHEACAAPVPEVIAFEDEADVLGGRFFIMRFVEGRTPPDQPPYSVAGWVLDLLPREREALWWSGLRAMAGVANFDWTQKLSDLQKRPTPAGELARELEYYGELYDRHCGNVYGGIIADVRNWIASATVTPSVAVLMWGDARPGNMIFQGTECAAILDWEMSSIGAIECDIAWWLFLDQYYHEGHGVARAAGWPSHSETIAEYERLTNRRIGDLTLYKMFAVYRAAVISARFTALGVLPELSMDDFIPKRMFDLIQKEC